MYSDYNIYSDSYCCVIYEIYMHQNLRKKKYNIKGKTKLLDAKSHQRSRDI